MKLLRMLGLYGGTLVAFAAHASKSCQGCLLSLLGCSPNAPSSFETSARKFSAATYKICDPLELFFFPHLSVGKVNSLLWKLHFGGLLRVILVARQKWVFLRSRLP